MSAALPIKRLDIEGYSEGEIRARMKAGEPPATAEEYLLRVRLEADDIGPVIRSKSNNNRNSNNNNDTSTTPSKTTAKKQTILPDFQACPPSLLPSKVWQRHCASCFAECRQYILRVEALYANDTTYKSPTVPPMNDGYAWERLCFGTNSFAVATGNHTPAPVPLDETLPPLLRVVIGLSAVNVSKLLTKHVRWLCTGSNNSSRDNKDKGAVKRGRPLTLVRAAWLYALLARIDKPLSRKDSSTLRTLGRYLSEMRVMLSPDDHRLPSFNLILTLIEYGFGQGRIGSNLSNTKNGGNDSL